MPESQDTIHLGVIDLITQAGPVVQFVLFLLVLASVFSWAIMLAKSRMIRGAASQNGRFLTIFWQGKNMDDIFSKTEDLKKSPIATVYKSGFKELKKVTSGERSTTGAEIENINRAMTRAAQVSITGLEKHVAWLATTASASPFIGLFGTVWGIMNSFRNIGATGAANLAVVAPGISEALIATAMGLAAAIPAVIAYNHFVNQIKKLAVETDCFAQDFLNIVQRSLMGGQKKSKS